MLSPQRIAEHNIILVVAQGVVVLGATPADDVIIRALSRGLGQKFPFQRVEDTESVAFGTEFVTCHLYELVDGGLAHIVAEVVNAARLVDRSLGAGQVEEAFALAAIQKRQKSLQQRHSTQHVLAVDPLHNSAVYAVPRREAILRIDGISGIKEEVQFAGLLFKRRRGLFRVEGQKRNPFNAIFA